MMVLVLGALGFVGLTCLFVIRRVIRSDTDIQAGGDVMVIGDRPSKPLLKSSVGVKTGPARVTVTLRVPDPKCACEFARRIVGKTFEPEQAPKLPLAGCGLVECRCRYDKVTERRGKVRREKEERRDMIRFEMKDNRRKESDRRKTNTRWGGPR